MIYSAQLVGIPGSTSKFKLHHKSWLAQHLPFFWFLIASHSIVILPLPFSKKLFLRVQPYAFFLLLSSFYCKKPIFLASLMDSKVTFVSHMHHMCKTLMVKGLNLNISQSILAVSDKIEEIPGLGTDLQFPNIQNRYWMIWTSRWSGPAGTHGCHLRYTKNKRPKEISVVWLNHTLFGKGETWNCNNCKIEKSLTTVLDK